MESLQPTVDATSLAGGHLLVETHQLLGSEALQNTHVHSPERLGLPDQPGPGAGGLPASQALQQRIHRRWKPGRAQIHPRRRQTTPQAWLREWDQGADLPNSFGIGVGNQRPPSPLTRA